MNETYRKIFPYIFNRLIVACLSSLTFGCLYALKFITPASEQAPNVYYFGFFEIFFFVNTFTMPLYLLVAVPFSIFMDLNKKTAHFSYWTKALCYVLAGVGTGSVVMLLFGAETFDKVLFGAGNGFVNGLLFFGFIVILPMIKRNFQLNETHSSIF